MDDSTKITIDSMADTSIEESLIDTLDIGNLSIDYSSTLTWTNSPISISAAPYIFSDSSDSGNISNSSIHASGDVIVDGDLKIQGESIKELLEEIKDKLAILKPNPELEERWEKLKELRRQYVELEKDILEKEEIVRILKL